MTFANPFTRWNDRAAEEALDRSLERLARDPARAGSLIVAREPAHAFELRPLLEAALDLREAFASETPAPAAREELMALIRRTPQEPRRSGVITVLRSLPSLPDGWALIVGGGARRGFAATALAASVGVAVLLGGVGGTGTPAAAATLTVVSGSVERLGGEAQGEVLDGAPVFEGDTLRLGPNAVAILTFVDGSTVQLSSGAELTVTRARFETPAAIHVEQRAGQVIADLPPDAEAGTSLKVDAPGAVIEVHSGGFAADVSVEGTRVQAFEQSVAVNSETRKPEVLVPGESRLIEPHSRRHDTPTSVPAQSAPLREQPGVSPADSSRGRSPGDAAGQPAVTPRKAEGPPADEKKSRGAELRTPERPAAPGGQQAP